MVKKILLVAFVLIGIVSFVNADAITDAYNQGYLDALNGTPNRYKNQKQEGLFKIFYFVDYFGDPTEKGYISNTELQEGMFSNSATRNAFLLWEIIAEKDYFSFVLYEYGRDRVECGYDYTSYIVHVKDESGNVTNYAAKNYSDRISLIGTSEEMLKLFSSGKSFKIVIEEKSEYSNSTYNLGTVSTEGFKELYESLE